MNLNTVVNWQLLNNELEIQETFRVEYEYEECGEYVFSKFKGCIYSEFCIQHDK